MQLKDFVKAVKEKFGGFTVGVKACGKATWLFIKKGKNNCSNVFIDEVAEGLVVSFNKLGTDELFRCELTKQTKDEILAHIKDNVEGFCKYYETLKNVDEIRATLSSLNQTICSAIDQPNIKLNIDDTNDTFLMAGVCDKQTGQALANRPMYRLSFEPSGYVAMLMYNDPYDEQIDYVVPSNLNAFIEKLNDTICPKPNKQQR